jgi:riboflavin synthase
MEIHSPFLLQDIKVGDSIAVSGACLTAVKIERQTFKVDVAPETLSKTTLGRIKAGDRVNLEGALRMGDRLSGHLVTGHVDGMGKVKARRTKANAILFTFGVPEELGRYIVPKGSVAVDGISLTVNACDRNTFEVSIIPHTASLTTLGFRQVGDLVNIETDMVAKYIERFTRHLAADPGKADMEMSVDEALLKKTGFL